jgi:periplasmic divalent cation tolerance protein
MSHLRLSPTRLALTRLVLTTAANREEAERIAHTLVEERLAACVNLLPGMHSVYRWQGKVESAEEVQLLIKTRDGTVDQVCRRLHQLHSYEVPEFLVLEAHGESEAYLQWLLASVD